MQMWDGYKHKGAPGTRRDVIQLTKGNATCYPLYYFIPSVSNGGRTLVYHRAEAGEVQIHALDLVSGESLQLTHASAPETRWTPWCVESGKGVLDHRSVFDVQSERLVYFDGNGVRQVTLAGTDDQHLFSLPDDRIAIGQNCMTGDGSWFVYIHHDRELFTKVYSEGGSRSLSKGTTLAAYNIRTGEHRILVQINSPIHHVLPFGEDALVFCHPATENGMLLTDIRGGWYTHMRTQDEFGGCVCHYVATRRGIMYEVLGRRDKRVLAGLYNPNTQNRYEFSLPPEFGYTHTGRDPEGRLWFFENSSRDGHDLRFLVRHDPRGQDKWISLTGHWPTFGKGQKSHFHPQLLPDREWALITAGDAETETNHIFLINVADLSDSEGIPDLK